MIISKTDTVRELVVNGNYKKALSIVKGFRRSIAKEDLGKMALAYECMTKNVGFYEQLGTDTTKAIADGITILTALYGQAEENG